MHRPSWTILLCVACASSPDLDDFDRSCTRDEDCALVPIGDACQVCPDQQGISMADEGAYRDQWARAAAQCGPRPAIACEVQAVQARCLGDVCRAAPVDTDPAGG